MEIGKVVFILTEEQSSDLLNLLEGAVFESISDEDKINAIDLKEQLVKASSVVYIDDVRKQEIDTL